LDVSSIKSGAGGAGGAGGTLFCFSLMVPGTAEVKLITWQHKNRASIFACDKPVVYSNVSTEVTPGVTTVEIDSNLKCGYGGDSGSALNAWIFISLWKTVVTDKTYAAYDWVVKVDPDCVFFPDRLGPVLASHQGVGYVNNCRYGMHGPIEVFSSGAITTLGLDYEKSWDGKAPKTCMKMHFGQWGEDMFIDQCLLKLGVTGPIDPRLMCEDHCDCPAWYWCKNGTDRVSFHPFKTVEAYENCMANALGGATGTTASTDTAAHRLSSGLVPMAQEEEEAAVEDDAVVDDAAPSTAAKEGTCKDYCDGAFDAGRSCQCNEECQEHDSCCEDYKDVCQQSSVPRAAATSEEKPTAPPSSDSCHDATEGEECFTATKWAAEHGIFEHEEWYTPLTAQSSFQEFQKNIHDKNKTTCPVPCKEAPDPAKASPAPPAGDVPAGDVPTGPLKQTFYMYRAQSQASYPLENTNAADLAGVMWYIHNEVVTATPRKYKIDRVKRYKVTVRNTWEFWNTHKRQFGPFVAFDAARCSTPICKKLYNQYGFIVGCQAQGTEVAGYLGKTQTNWNCKKGEDKCKAPLWYSLPGPCPGLGISNGEIDANKVGLDVNAAKTPDCKARMPGGHCAGGAVANGNPDCTYSYEEAGQIFLNELVGITDYDNWWNGSYVKCQDDVAQHVLPADHECIQNKEYDLHLDKGIGTTFWDGKHDAVKCQERMDKVRQLFFQKNPSFPLSLEEPPCEFDMFYGGEFDWKVNHTGAPASNWWTQRMPV
jgi:hypothetical protein